MKGYKGYKKGLVCRDKQYKEGEIFEENVKPDVCSQGMHFCENPLDVFEFYPPDGSNVYTDVEALGETHTEETKTSTNKLKIGFNISISNLFKAAFDLVKETCVSSKEANTSGDYAHANTSGNYAHANTSGYKAHANTSGYYAHANTSGNEAHANTSGYYAHANTSGDYAHANTSGDYAHANTSGYKAHANTSGDYAHANTSGN